MKKSPPPSGSTTFAKATSAATSAPKRSLPPGAAAGFVAVSNQAKAHDQICIRCLARLPHFLNPGQCYSASVSSNNPLLRHYTLYPQAAQRQLHQPNVYDLSLARQTNVLIGQIQHRLTSADTRPGPAPSNHQGAL